MISRWIFLSAAVLCLAVLHGCADGADDVPGEEPTVDGVALVRDACRDAVNHSAAVCQAQCSRLADTQASLACDMQCDSERDTVIEQCASPLKDFVNACPGPACADDVSDCREQNKTAFDACSAGCTDGDLFCSRGCDERASAAEFQCGFMPASVARGGVVAPQRDVGRRAELSATLDAAELAVVQAADERAESLRSRVVRVWTDSPATAVKLTQLEHDFAFGVPLDIREFNEGDGRLDYYGTIARANTSLLVAETSLKWRNSEPEEGVFQFDLADRELAWAQAQNFDVKAHVLVWGNPPPLASGSGTPEWLREKFPEEELSPEQADALRALIKQRIETVVGRYSGRIAVWEVTNEMLNPLTDWFATRLGPGIVDDAFRWARAADPGAELVYNEWINEIFTGLGGPDSAAVRDRVIALREAGVPVNALGQQGHFAPGLVNVGIDIDLDKRTRIDDYARALDTLAQAGLPIHITEVTFAAPEDPEQRAAQAEAVMRVWWGHPSVEEIIFWNFWNPLGPRSRLNLGIYDEDGNLSRHGEAILSLLNDRWRTDVELLAQDDGSIQSRAVFGRYVAQWDTADGPVHIEFDVPPGTGVFNVLAVSSNPAESE